MKRLLFVYNPTSGKGAITGNVTTIVDAFTKAGWLVTIYPTQGTGDATRVTRELAPQFDRVVCCGGDGTLSETAAGLLALPQPAGLHPLRFHQRLRRHPPHPTGL